MTVSARLIVCCVGYVCICVSVYSMHTVLLTGWTGLDWPRVIVMAHSVTHCPVLIPVSLSLTGTSTLASAHYY